MASADLQEELLCSICLNTYTDPVTLRCGHNFCRVCIDQHLNTQHESGVYSCPDCRTRFRKRPTLQRNITLHNVAEHFLSTQSHEEEITGIRCTYCIHSPVPAVRSCLLCEASLCDNHLKVHSKSAVHVLTDPSTSLEIRKCSVHKKILEYYCNEDAACICVSCSLAGEHRGHRVEMLDEASEKKKKILRNVLQKLITEREETEERVQSLEECWRKAQEKASGEVERVTALFIGIRTWLGDLEKKVLSDISRQEEQQSLSLSDVIQKLEIKKAELSRKMRHIEELCNMTDPLTVLQEPDIGDLCDPEEDGGDEDIGGHDGGDEDTEGHDRVDENTGGGDEDTGGHDGGDEDTDGYDGSDEDTGGHGGGDETGGHDGVDDTDGYDGSDEDTGGHGGGDEETGGHDGGDEDTGEPDGGDEDMGGHDEGDEDPGGHDKTHDVDVKAITRMLLAGFSDIITYLQTISPANPKQIRTQPPSIQSLPSHTQDLPLSGTTYGGDDVIVRTGGVGEKITAEGQEGIYGQGPADILLDINTAANDILISEDLKTATWTEILQNRPETAERFQDYQVMSSSSFSSGLHYWDLEIRGSALWMVGMCYPSTDRRGNQSYIGDNNKSWGFYRELGCNNQYSVIHDSKEIRLPHQISSDRFRICLDYEAGRLSFYELCDPIRHLHTFTATFTKRLHAVLCVLEGSIKVSGV